MIAILRKLFVAGSVIAWLSTAAFAQIAPDADIMVLKTGPANALAGDNVVYTITLTNGGRGPATGVSMDDNIPTGMTFVSLLFDAAFTCATPAVGAGGAINCTAPNLAVGATATFTLTVNIPLRAPMGSQYTNIAFGTAANDINDENNSSAAVTTIPLPRADLSILKQGPSSAGVDTDVTYTITLVNSGPAAATDVAVSDTLPGNLTFVSLTQGGQALTCTTPTVGAGGTINCTATTYPIGATTTLTLVAHVPAGTPLGTSYTNQATVQSTNDPQEENNQATTQFSLSGSADMRAAKTGPANVNAGDNFTYTLTIANDGPDAATNARLYDPIPANASFVSYQQLTGPNAGCAIGNALDCTIPSLAAGGSATFSLTLRAGASGTAVNTVTVSSEAFDANPNNNAASVTTTIQAVADVSVSKSGPNTVVAGTNITYTIIVANAGPSPAANVSMADSFPGNTSFVSLTQNNGPAFACGSTQTTSTCTIGSLAAGAQAQFTLTLMVLPSAPPGVLSNSATATTSSTDTNPNNNTGTKDTAISASADVGIAKTGPANVAAGQMITYSITVSNTGPSDAAQVGFTDPLPPGTTFVSNTQNGGPTFTCTVPAAGQGGTISCTRTTLAAGASASFTVVLNVAAGATGVLTNTASVTTATADTNPNNGSATATANVVASSDVAVNMTGPATVNAGATATYTINVVNNGPSNATGVTLSDVLPAGTTFVSIAQGAGPVFTCATPAVGANGTVTCTLAGLAPATPATFTLILNVTQAATSPIVNTATVASTSNDATPANNSSSVTTTIIRADVSVTKTAPQVATPGATIAYVITVANAGPSAAATVALTDALPANTTFASLTQDNGPAFTCTTPAVGGTGNVACNIASLASGASAQFTLTLNISGAAVGALSNTASVASATPDPTAGNNSATATAMLGPSADLSVAKTGPATVTPGQNATYTVVVSNAGPSDAANATMTDVLPANTTFVSVTQKTGPAFTCTTPAVNAAGTVACTIASLANGASASFEIVVKIDPNATQPISNTASVSSTTADPRPANASAAAAAAIALAPTDIAVEQTATFDPLATTKTIRWTITVRNLGPGVANNVVVSDTLQTGLALVSAVPSQGTCTGAPAITCSLGVIAVGASATITLNTTLASNQTTAINTASATTDNPDTNAANNAATAYAQFTPALIPTMSWTGMIALMLSLMAIGGWMAARRPRN